MENLCGHVEGDENELGSFGISETPVKPTAVSTAEEFAAYRAWWLKDIKVKTIIERRINLVALSLIPRGITTTAREVPWSEIKTMYDRVNIMERFKLLGIMADAKLKDHRELDSYLAVFTSVRDGLLKMGVSFTENEMVFEIQRGLPETTSWLNLRSTLAHVVQNYNDCQSERAFHDPPDTLLNMVVGYLRLECKRLDGMQPSETGRGSSRQTRKHDINRLGVQ